MKEIDFVKSRVGDKKIRKEISRRNDQIRKKDERTPRRKSSKRNGKKRNKNGKLTQIKINNNT